jgi:hypothetical protein
MTPSPGVQLETRDSSQDFLDRFLAKVHWKCNSASTVL